MGIFDLFGKEPTKNDRRERFVEDSVITSPEQQKGNPVSVFFPNSFEDVALIIDALKAGKNAVVHLDKIKSYTATQILNILSGAVYALNGGLYEMQKDIYMFSPSGVEKNN